MTDEKNIIDDEEAILAARKKAARRAKSKGHREESAGGLNINSMMDMMVIILCFLLKSVGAEPIQVNQSDDLRLTFSTTEIAPEDMLILSITKSWIMVEDDQVIPIGPDGRIDATERQSAESAILPALQQQVEEVLAEQEQWARVAGREYDRVATIVCDEDVPYRILTQVMITSSQAGIQNFKFAVLQREQGSGVAAQ